jgi:hypothetical protein
MALLHKLVVTRRIDSVDKGRSICELASFSLLFSILWLGFRTRSPLYDIGTLMDRAALRRVSIRELAFFQLAFFRFFGLVSGPGPLFMISGMADQREGGRRIHGTDGVYGKAIAQDGFACCFYRIGLLGVWFHGLGKGYQGNSVRVLGENAKGKGHVR